MNWNPFKKSEPKPDAAVARHEELMTAVAGLHERLNKLELMISAESESLEKDLLLEITASEGRALRAATSLDESLGSEIVKGLEEQKLWLRKQFQALAAQQAANAIPAAPVPEPHLLYDVQVDESTGKITDIKAHGELWALSDTKPPFKVTQLELTAAKAAEIRAKLS